MFRPVGFLAVALGILGVASAVFSFSGSETQHDAIETIGIGRVDPKLTNETQRQATAREAAVQEAQAKMLSILIGRRSNGKTQNQEAVRSGILRGAEIVKTEWLAGDQCRVTLRLDRQRYETLTGDRLSD